MTRKNSGDEVSIPLTADTRRRDASLHLFDEYLRQMQVQAEAWRRSEDDQSLHQFRVSLRRCRVLLRVFSVDADEHGGKALRLALTRVADKLGLVRDLDVILALVMKSDFGRSGRNEAELAPLVAKITGQRGILLRRTARHFADSAGPRVAALAKQFIGRWRTHEFPEDRQTIKEFLDREFSHHGRRIMRAEGMARSGHPETLHLFRIRLRRLRYLGDLLHAIAGEKQKRAFKRIHECEQELGRIHDLDMALAFMEGHPNETPVMLRRELERKRLKKLGKFLGKWRKCRKRLEK